MKKFFTLIVSSILLSSCVSYNKEMLNLDVSVAPKYSDYGGSQAIRLVVVDDRLDRNLLGNKRLGENLIAIKSNQNLTDVIKDKIAKDLGQNGFLAVDGGMVNKVLEIHIINFNYNAYRDFFVGNSKIDVLLKITAKNKAYGTSYTTKQSLSLNKKHFIMPLITTDEQTINFALQDALDGILANQQLLEFLKN